VVNVPGPLKKTNRGQHDSRWRVVLLEGGLDAKQGGPFDRKGLLVGIITDPRATGLDSTRGNPGLPPPPPLSRWKMNVNKNGRPKKPPAASVDPAVFPFLPCRAFGQFRSSSLLGDREKVPMGRFPPGG